MQMGKQRKTLITVHSVKRTASLAFFFLSLYALAYIGYDYACGHIGESFYEDNDCVICQAYQSTENSYSILETFFLFLFPIIFSALSLTTWFYISSQHLSIVSLRAPPSS